MLARVLAFAAVLTFTVPCQASIAPNSYWVRLFEIELAHHEDKDNKPAQTDRARHLDLDVMSPMERRKLLSNPYVLGLIIAAAIAIPLIEGRDAKIDRDTESQPASNKPSR